MTLYLFDTNHLVSVLKRVEPLRPKLTQARVVGHRFGVGFPVLCETESYIEGSARREQNRKVLDRFMAHVKIWPTVPKTARFFGAIFLELRRSGRVLSQVDIMTAAMARQFNAIILTSDQDFEALPDIKTENWLV